MRSIATRLLQLCLVVGVAILNLHFVLAYADGSRWKAAEGTVPTVKYAVFAASMAGDARAVFVNAVNGASDAWSARRTQAHVSLAFAGTTTVPAFLPASAVMGAQALQGTENTVFASVAADPDCTAPVCSFVWDTGSGAITHFDIQWNRADFSFPEGSVEERSHLAHAFGHALGLDHCTPGDLPSTCAARSSAGDPDGTNIMHRFISGGLALSQPGSDDLSGLRQLYGAFTEEEKAMVATMDTFVARAESICNPSPCLTPENETRPEYRLSPVEMQSLARLDAARGADGLNTREWRLSVAQIQQSLRDEAYMQNKASAEQYMLASIDSMTAYIPGMTTEMLQLQRQVLSTQIRDRTIMLDELADDLGDDYLRFVRAERNVLIQIRRAMIDELAKR